MRVLIASDTADVRNGGACVQLWNLKRLLEGAGHEVRVFSFDGDNRGDESWLSVREPRTLPGRKLAKLTFYPRGYRALRRMVLGFQPDIVHVNNNFKVPATMLSCSGATPATETIWPYPSEYVLSPMNVTAPASLATRWPSWLGDGNRLAPAARELLAPTVTSLNTVTMPLSTLSSR